MKGDSFATAINTGDFSRVDGLNSVKSTRHDPVTTRRVNRNKTSQWERLNDVKMPSKTWDYVVQHTSSSHKGDNPDTSDNNTTTSRQGEE